MKTFNSPPFIELSVIIYFPSEDAVSIRTSVGKGERVSVLERLPSVKAIDTFCPV